ASANGYPCEARPSLRQIFRAFRAAAWGLGLPVILPCGIYSGVFTPTESAAVACMNGWFVGAVIYRHITFKDLVGILRSSGLTSATLLLITAGASAFAWLLASSGAPTKLAAEVLSLSNDPIVVMALFNVVMLVAGFFLDSASAIIVLSPLLQPIAAQVGVDAT